MNVRYLLNKASQIKSSVKPGYLTIINDLNHFNIFGETVNYVIDKKSLEGSYKELQKSIHPDKYANSPQYKQMESLSSYINKAYNTLKDDYKRSVYLLKIKGIYITENDKLKNKEHLNEIIEINEKVQEEIYNLMSLKEDVKEKIEEIKYDFNEAFKNEDYDNAKQYCILLSYYINIDHEIYNKINDI